MMFGSLKFKLSSYNKLVLIACPDCSERGLNYSIIELISSFFNVLFFTSALLASPLVGWGVIIQKTIAQTLYVAPFYVHALRD